MAPTTAMAMTAIAATPQDGERLSVRRHPVGEPSRHRFGSQHVVEDHLQRPRLQQVRGALHDHGGERHREQLPVRPQQLCQAYAAGRHDVPLCAVLRRLAAYHKRRTHLTKCRGVSA